MWCLLALVGRPCIVPISTSEARLTIGTWIHEPVNDFMRTELERSMFLNTEHDTYDKGHIAWVDSEDSVTVVVLVKHVKKRKALVCDVAYSDPHDACRLVEVLATCDHIVPTSISISLHDRWKLEFLYHLS